MPLFTGSACDSVGAGGTCTLTLIDLWAESIQECYEPGPAELFCPMDDDLTLIPMSANLLCQVCSVGTFTDMDPRAGILTGVIHFGPNQRGGAADESVLWGYRLTFTDACGAELAEIGKVSKRSYPPAVCCDPKRYSFRLESVLVPPNAVGIMIAPYKGNWRLLGGHLDPVYHRDAHVLDDNDCAANKQSSIAWAERAVHEMVTFEPKAPAWALSLDVAVGQPSGNWTIRAHDALGWKPNLALAMRPLLRLLRLLEGWPNAALLGRPLRRFHPKLGRTVKIPRGEHPFADEALYELSGQRTEYAHPALRAAAVGRKMLRRVQAGLAHEADIEELIRRLEANLEFTSRLARASGAPATEEFARGYRNAHLETAKVGSILLAHPLSCIFQRELDRAVILLDGMHPSGLHLRGTVVNKPDLTLQEALASWPPSERERLEEDGLGPLLGCRLFLGGDLVPPLPKFRDRLQWHHALPEVPGSRQKAPGLWTGGDMRVAAKMVEEGSKPIWAVRPVLGYSGWQSEQLELELERGVWAQLRASQEAEALLTEEPASLWKRLALGVGLRSFADFPRGVVDPLIQRRVEENSQKQAGGFPRLRAAGAQAVHGRIAEPPIQNSPRLGQGRASSGFAHTAFYDCLAPLVLEKLPEIHPISRALGA
ncbi:unnamed protein product [Effrenium voratum]|nr:unnamed protein product [Effrenium voratum]